MTTPAAVPAVSLLPVRDLDFDELFRMFEAYCAEVEPLDPLGTPPESSDERRDALLDGASDEEWCWIIADGQRAGFVMVQVYEDDPLPGDRTAEVLECYVAPEARRRGVGRAAIEAVLAEERGRGTTVMEAGILRANEGAIAFWEAMGFATRSVQVARRL